MQAFERILRTADLPTSVQLRLETPGPSRLPKLDFKAVQKIASFLKSPFPPNN